VLIALERSSGSPILRLQIGHQSLQLVEALELVLPVLASFIARIVFAFGVSGSCGCALALAVRALCASPSESRRGVMAADPASAGARA
jgi:hypothetical protein